MAIVKRLALVGVLPYATGEQVATGFGEAGLRWLVDPLAQGSLTAYWRDASGGQVDLSGSSAFGWLIVEDTGLRDTISGQDRSAACQAACDVAGRAGVPLTNYDGVILLVGGRKVNGGQAWARIGRRVVPCALLDEVSEHSFMTHEVGHVVGLDHSFRPAWTNPTPGVLYGEYGDPTDTMSARTFGARGDQVVFPLRHDRQADIAPTVRMWAEAGPGVSPATVWRYGPSFPAPEPFVRLLSPGAPAVPVRLRSPDATSGTTLVALPLPTGNGFTTVEYRPARAWDRALTYDPAEPSGSPGLVVHTIRDLGTPADGQSWPRLQRVCYEATVPVPSAGDDDWEDGRLAVRLIDADETSARILIGATLPGAAAVRLSAAVTPGQLTRVPGGPVDVTLVGPSCGTRTYTTEVVDQPVAVGVAAAAVGFDDPELRFAVNGVDVGTWARLGDPPMSTSLTARATVTVPIGLHDGVTQEQHVPLGVTRAGNTLSVAAPPGTGTYELTVGVWVRGQGRQAASSETVTVTTRYVDLPAEAKRDQRECADFLLRKGLRGRRQDEMPDIIGPVSELPDLTDWGQLAPEALAESLLKLAALERENARLGRTLATRVAEVLGVHTQDLRDVVAALERSRGPVR